MRRTTPRPGGKLIDIRSAEREFGLSYTTLLDLVKRGLLAAVQPPHRRRYYIVRADLEQKLATWRVESSA